MHTVLIVIARMGSSRLPGKVMMDLGGKPVLEWVTDAALRCKLVNDVIIATTTDIRDNEIAGWAARQYLSYYRGSEDDVLDRFFWAARNQDTDVVVRVTADCPFLDPNVIDQVIALRETTGVAYASNVYPPTWPDG